MEIGVYDYDQDDDGDSAAFVPASPRPLPLPAGGMIEIPQDELPVPFPCTAAS